MTRMTVALWAFSAGLSLGLYVCYLEASARQYVRAPGSANTVRIHGRKRT
jgi:hypothetical protein